MLTLVLLFGLGCAPRPDLGIKFEAEVHDFGIKDEGPNLEHEFIFTNTGKQTIEILDVKSSCNCTVADNWDKIVAPGKKGQISITFRTTGYQGEITRTIDVTTNIPDQKTITLTIKVNVKTPIAITPKNVWLGEFPATHNQSLSGTFEINNNLGTPLKIIEISVPDDKTRFTLTTLEQNNKYRVDFTVDPPFAGEDTVKREFRIKTDNEKYPEIVPTYSYLILPPVYIFPTILNVNLDQLKEYEFMTSINIKSFMEKPIRIEDLKLIGGKGLHYEILEAARGKVYQILITVPMNYVHNKDEKVYFVFSVLNDPKKKSYNIPVQFIKT
jgi:hypothetical protein